DFLQRIEITKLDRDDSLPERPGIYDQQAFAGSRRNSGFDIPLAVRLAGNRDTVDGQRVRCIAARHLSFLNGGLGIAVLDVTRTMFRWARPRGSSGVIRVLGV